MTVVLKVRGFVDWHEFGRKVEFVSSKMNLLVFQLCVNITSKVSLL